jgi:prepilin-type N-terminal cleavage/methylation domain-containing protein
MSRTPNNAARRGFTLVELLVAAALSVLVMYVLAEAFKAGTDTLSQLKSVAGLADQLRTAETIIRRDLKQQHLENDKGESVLVSDQSVASTAGWKAPNRGFFKVVQASVSTTGSASELSDGNGISSARTTHDWLQFTNKLTGKTADQVFIVPAPATNPTSTVGSNIGLSTSNMLDFATLSASSGGAATFAGKWGEVTYFLKKQDNAFMPPDVTNPRDLHVLYRRARVLLPPASQAVTVTGEASIIGPTAYFPELSGHVQNPTTNVWTMNTPERATDPQFRLGSTLNAGGAATANGPIPPGFATTLPSPITAADANNFGSDILLMNVVSMRVQLLNSTTLAYDPSALPSTTTQWDTYQSSANNSPPRVLGIKIELRVYDTKNMVTRQVTIAQPL